MLKELQTMMDRGLVETLPTGHVGVRVSLQYRPRMSTPSRAERSELLKQAFVMLLPVLEDKGADLDLSSLSVSGQTVQARFPIEAYEPLTKELEGRQVRVDLLVDRKLTE